MSKHVAEKCGKLADGDPDGRTETRTDGRIDITIPLYVPSEDGRIKINYLLSIDIDPVIFANMQITFIM